MSVYIHELPADPTVRSSVKVVSHVEQLALSACARKSDGKLWCGTCHDPHRPPASTQLYRERCMRYLEQPPEPENRVSLSADKDQFGLPQTSLSWKLGEASRASAERSVTVRSDRNSAVRA